MAVGKVLHRGSFSNLKYFKTGKEIMKKASGKSKELKEKAAARKERITKIIASKNITAADVLANLNSFDVYTYGTSSMSNMAGGDETHDPLASLPLTLGEQQQIKTESQNIQREIAEAEELDLIVRNLAPSQSFEMSGTDLEYLGF